MSDASRHGLLRLQVLVLGLALWAFALLLPWLHLAAPGTARAVADLLREPLLLLPVAALLAGVASGRATWLVTGVPLALLPAVLHDPSLVGERVYGFPAFVLTGAVLAAWVALAAQVGAAPVTAAGPARETLSGRVRTAGAGLTAALVVTFAAFAWWAAFDPGVVWEGGGSAEAAAARDHGRSVPALVLIACWLATVTRFLAPVAAGILTAGILDRSRPEPSPAPTARRDPADDAGGL